MTRRAVLSVSLVVAVAVIAAVVAARRDPGARRGGTLARPGADAVVATQPRIVTVEVGGMVCAGCVAKIQNTLTAVPGVRRVEVSLRDQRASVLCDPAVADTSLTTAVRRAGPEYIGFVLAP